jgi:hypothetical protein
MGIAVDAGGNAYVTGHTLAADFPTTPGAFQRNYGGVPPNSAGGDAFITKLVTRPPANVLVNDPNEDGNSPNDTQSETTLVLGANNSVIVAYNDSFFGGANPPQYTGYSVSNDGGNRFADTGRLPANPNGDYGDPVLARDNVTGRVYLATQSSDPAVTNVYHSDNNGNNFAAPVNGAPGHPGAFLDKEWLTVDNFAGPGRGNVSKQRPDHAASVPELRSTTRVSASNGGVRGQPWSMRSLIGTTAPWHEAPTSKSRCSEAFLFMNRAMSWQRTQSIFSEKVRRGDAVKYEDVDVPGNRSWDPFQIAFILLNLPGVTKLDHSERSDEPDALADLLWFPTGGGKTEAYLGLAAFTMALRRLRGTVAGREGENGVAVLMIPKALIERYWG